MPGLNPTLDDCKAWWKFNDDEANRDVDNAIDATNNGTMHGTDDSEDVSDTGVSAGNTFDCFNEYKGGAHKDIETHVSDHANIDVGTGDFCISTWLYIDTRGSTTYKEAFQKGGGGTALWHLIWNGVGGFVDDDAVFGANTHTQNTFEFRIYDAGGKLARVESAAVANNSGWHLVVCGRNDTGLWISLDGGAKVTTDEQEAGFDPDSNLNNAFDLILASGNGNHPWRGKIDTTMLWGRELTDAEIDYIYNNGNGTENFDKAIVDPPPVGVGEGILTDMELIREKNVATSITFPLVDSDYALVSGEDSGANATETYEGWSDSVAASAMGACSNGISELGSTGIYSLSLTADEMNNDYIIVNIATDNSVGQTLLIRTTNAPANVKEVSDSSTAADNLEVVFDTDFATAYSTANDMWNVDAVKISGSGSAADRIEQVYVTDWTTSYDDTNKYWNSADSVLDELLSGHTDTGSVGEAIGFVDLQISVLQQNLYDYGDANWSSGDSNDITVSSDFIEVQDV